MGARLEHDSTLKPYPDSFGESFRHLSWTHQEEDLTKRGWNVFRSLMTIWEVVADPPLDPRRRPDDPARGSFPKMDYLGEFAL